jgi:putative heme-binding domain-containing protein
MLEQHPLPLAQFLDSHAGKTLPVENRLVATLALEPKVSASGVAQLLPQLRQPPGAEELLRLAGFPDEPGVHDAMVAILRDSATRAATLQGLLQVRSRLDASKMSPILTDPVRALLAGDSASVDLGIQAASAFQLTGLEGDLMAILRRGWEQALAAGTNSPGGLALPPQAQAALRALREMQAGNVELFAKLAKSGATGSTRTEALAALTASRSERAVPLVLELWQNLSTSQRRVALDRLTGSKASAQAVVEAIKTGLIPKTDLDGPSFEKLQTVLGDDAELRVLLGDMASLFRPCLRLNGAPNAWSETDITLDGPFTVETWVKLDPGIDNNDGILAAPGVLDMNFAGGQFRVWVGGSTHDAIVAKKQTHPDIWTHVAVTRDLAGRFRIYVNGELDCADSKAAPQKFDHCRIGWTTAGKGTAGWLSESRVWDRVRTAEEIRSEFDRSYEGEHAAGLSCYFSGLHWGKLRPGARVEKTQDFPALMTAAQSQALAGTFAKFRALAQKSGNLTHGQQLFATTCQTCHSVGGQGGQIGPVLNGAGALGIDALLRNILTPNAAMEPGYRVFRLELKDGDVLDGIHVSEDEDAFVLRRPNSQDLRVSRRDVLRSHYTKLSMMPEGLLETLKPEDVSDLFTYLKGLK